jgi:hypothetical protein
MAQSGAAERAQLLGHLLRRAPEEATPQSSDGRCASAVSHVARSICSGSSSVARYSQPNGWVNPNRDQSSPEEQTCDSVHPSVVCSRANAVGRASATGGAARAGVGRDLTFYPRHPPSPRHRKDPAKHFRKLTESRSTGSRRRGSEAPLSPIAPGYCLASPDRNSERMYPIVRLA